MTNKMDEIEEADRIASKSKLTEKDVEELASSVDKAIAKQWKHSCGSCKKQK